MTRLRWLVPLLTLAACGPEPPEPPVEEPRAERSDSAAVAALAATLDRATALADSIEDVLRPIPLMRPSDEAALRRFLNDTHVATARELGVRVRSREHLDSLVRAGTLVPLEDSTRYWVLRYGAGPGDVVVPHTVALLEEIGERFQDRLAEIGLPPYRLEITSTLRTAAEQARLRQRNPNAAAGVSSHEFGTTVDIVYSTYPPPRELPEPVRVDAPPGMRPYLDRVAAVTLESVSARKSRELKAILGDVLQEAQADGLVRVIYERFQPVYHVTVARRF